MSVETLQSCSRVLAWIPHHPRLICAAATSCVQGSRRNLGGRACCDTHVSSELSYAAYMSTYTGVFPACDRVTRIDMLTLRVAVAVAARSLRGAYALHSGYGPQRGKG